MAEAALSLYLEAHVTIAPILQEQEREQAQKLVAPYGFKLAHLVMIKNGHETLSTRDAFMTAHGKDIDDMAVRTRAAVVALGSHGFKVWRYKIESCTIDSRQLGDIWECLDPGRPQLPLIACDGCARV
jgi:hypothetical protein